MISSCRTAHRRIFGALVFVLPALLLASVALRPEVPPAPDDAKALFREAGFTVFPSGQPASIFGADPVIVYSLGYQSIVRRIHVGLLSRGRMEPNDALLVAAVVIYIQGFF